MNGVHCEVAFVPEHQLILNKKTPTNEHWFMCSVSTRKKVETTPRIERGKLHQYNTCMGASVIQKKIRQRRSPRGKEGEKEGDSGGIYVQQ